VLYAHGTNTDKTLNIADITNTSNAEGVLIAAMFAAQGYIVVAPNLPGYDISTLGYHPFLDAEQQSGEMNRHFGGRAHGSAQDPEVPRPATAASCSSPGTSEGGHVAMATQRALEASGAVITGARPCPDPMHWEAFGDAIFFGQLSTWVDRLLAACSPPATRKPIRTSMTLPGDLYSATYVSAIEPAASADPANTLFATACCRRSALFRQQHADGARQRRADGSAFWVAVPGSPTYPIRPVRKLRCRGRVRFALFDQQLLPSELMRSTRRRTPTARCPRRSPTCRSPATAPLQPLSLAFYKNDLSNGAWTPSSPTLCAAGGQDPTVFFSREHR